MQRKFVPAIGEFYHVYNRGVEKRSIFHDDHDRERFLRLLYLGNGTRNFVSKDVIKKPLELFDKGNVIVAIGAYCLMPNHFHILIREISDGGIARFMQKLTTAYSMHYNKRHNRVGPLFQGRYAIRHADEDRYLQYLYSYIHLNPVKMIDPDWKTNGIKNAEKTQEYLRNYKYSSLPDYLNIDRKEKSILSPSEFPEYFLTPRNVSHHINDWLKWKNYGATTDT